MKVVRLCEECGAIHIDAAKHRLFHEDLVAWTRLVELQAEYRIRSRQRQSRDGE